MVPQQPPKSPQQFAEQVFDANSITMPIEVPIPEHLQPVCRWYSEFAQGILTLGRPKEADPTEAPGKGLTDADLQFVLGALAAERQAMLNALVQQPGELPDLPIIASDNDVHWQLYQLMLRKHKTGDAMTHLINAVRGTFPNSHPQKMRLLRTLKKAEQLLHHGRLSDSAASD